jgi:hypothetical protein
MVYEISNKESAHSTPWSKVRRMLGLPAGRQGLILSDASYPDLKIRVWRRRTYQI